MKLMKLLSAAAFLPAVFACKSTDTRYSQDRTAESGVYSESERSSRDSQGRDTYARSDINRGVATVDLKTESGGRLNGTATILHNEGDSSDAKLIVHLENAEPGEYTVALGSTCNFSGGASGAMGGGASGAAGLEAHERETNSAAGEGSVSVGGSARDRGAEGGVSGNARIGDRSVSAGSSAGGSASALGNNDDEDTNVTGGADFGGSLGQNKELGTIEVSEDGIGHFEKSLTGENLAQSAAIIVTKSSDTDADRSASSSRRGEKSATQGRIDGEMASLSACGLISMPSGFSGGESGSSRGSFESESDRSSSLDDSSDDRIDDRRGS